MIAALVLPPMLLVGMGLWSHIERAETRYRALNIARAVATKIDAHFGDFENLLNRLSAEISTNPDDIDANDAALRHAKSELPSEIANIILLSLDGRNIGNAVGPHASAGDRDYFKRALAGESLVVGDPISSRSNIGWVIPVARAVKDSAGNIQAVLVVATFVDGFRERLGTSLPAGWLMKIVSENEVEVTTVSNGIQAAGSDLNRMGNPVRQLRLKEGSEVVTLHGNVTRTVGFSKAHRVPWLVAVGLPAENGSVQVAKGF